MAWDMDLLAGHDAEFLRRQWPTQDPLDYYAFGLNAGMLAALRENWDVVMVSGYVHANNWLIVGACKALGIPVLCFGDTNPNTDQGKPLWQRAVKRALLAPYLRAVSAFLVPGGQSRDYFVDYGASPESIFISPYVVDVDGFAEIIAKAGSAGLDKVRERFGVPPGSRVVAFCGKLVSWKRPLDIVHALRHLGRRDIVGLFIGEGPLREEIVRVGGDGVRVTGFVNRSEIPIVLKLADVLVLPSEIEPYGLVVSEAQTIGVPCIVSDRCGCHGRDSVLQDGQSGFVFPCGDIDALTARLRDLLEDGALHERMSASARVQGQSQSQRHAAAGFVAAATYAIGRKAASELNAGFR
jgi:glycosyltransferase involved in cell wall biosynthesis